MMQTFKTFLYESSRIGILHPKDMGPKELTSILSPKHIDFSDVTEKTDGTSFLMGHDELGFYTQSSNSGKERMRTANDYHVRGKRRAQETGTEYDPTINHRFGEFHSALADNISLRAELKRAYDKHGPIVLRGEMFHRKLASPSPVSPKEKVWVGTSYDPEKLNVKDVGGFVVHTKMPDNKWISHHDDFTGTHTDSSVGFVHDIVKHNTPNLDVSDLHKDFTKIDPNILHARMKPSNKAQVQAARQAAAEIAGRLQHKIDTHANMHNLPTKYGSGSEGHLVHSATPRFKITSAEFRQFKADTAGQDFRRR